jgi:hypothetical protein
MYLYRSIFVPERHSGSSFSGHKLERHCRTFFSCHWYNYHHPSPTELWVTLCGSEPFENEKIAIYIYIYICVCNWWGQHWYTMHWAVQGFVHNPGWNYLISWQTKYLYSKDLQECGRFVGPCLYNYKNSSSICIITR